MNQNNRDYITLPSVLTVDASFVLNFILLDEATHLPTSVVFERFNRGEVELLSSPLLYYEVGNILKTALNQKRLNEGLLFKLYENFMGLGIKIIEVNHNEAMKLAVTSGITFYDASYVHVSRVTGTPLLSYDEQLLKRIK